MSGVRAGSGGTGLRSGSQGTGVAGTEAISEYQAAAQALNASAQYPLLRKGSKPNPTPYATTILTGFGTNAAYPLRTFTADAPDIGTYDTVANFDRSFLVRPGAKGVAPDLGTYDTVSAGTDQSFLVRPGAKGVAPDLGTYDTVIAGNDPVRRYDTGAPPSAAPAKTNYDEVLATNDPVRIYRTDFITGVSTEPVYAMDAVMSGFGAQCTGWWKLDDSGTTIADSSGNDRDGIANNAVVPREELGPDGRRYAQFQNDDDGWYLGLVTIPNDLSGSMSAATHPVTFVALVKTDGSSPSYVVSKGAEAENEWQTYVTGTQWSTVAKSGYSVIASAEFEPLVTNGWQLIVARIPQQATPTAVGMYIDGAVSTPISPFVVGGGGDPYTNFGDDMFLGGQGPGSNFYGLNGAMAHAAIFPTALTDMQLGSIYDAAVTDGFLTAP